jgi:hypothetical protein
MSFHVIYEDCLLTISTVAELLILYYVYKEGRQVVANVNEIREATTGTVFGDTNDLTVGSRVQVLRPQQGVPREHWPPDFEVYVIREVDKMRNRAMATPVLPPPQAPTPTVEGPMRGPKSPFVKLNIPS